MERIRHCLGVQVKACKYNRAFLVIVLSFNQNVRDNYKVWVSVLYTLARSLARCLSL